MKEDKSRKEGIMNMRTIHTDEITDNIREMCIEANLHLASDVKNRIDQSQKSEKTP